MTRLLHLTDLHFGAERPELVAPLARAIQAAEPDLIAVTGDLSHRGRHPQLSRARTFLTRLQIPFTAQPGNHDVPLFNLPRRMLSPFGGWRRAIATRIPAETVHGPLWLHGANTADPFSLRRGRFRQRDLARILARVRRAPREALHVLTCHHPLTEPPGFERGETRGAAQALRALGAAGVRIALTGHMHHWAIGLGVDAATPQPMLMVQSGTALCGRPGERAHGFSVLEIGPARVTVTPWIVDEASRRFAPRAPHAFRLQGGLWHPDRP